MRVSSCIFALALVLASPVATSGAPLPGAHEPSGTVSGRGDSFRLDDPELLAGSGLKAGEPFEATFLADLDHVAVIEVTGNYDRAADGSFNVEPRLAVGQEFYRQHPDDYDFLFIFTTFEFDTGSARAFHFMVQNRVEGIGVDLFDQSDLIGSDGRLLGGIDMAALGRYQTLPLQPGFEDSLATMAHEVLHQWCCYSPAEGGALLGLQDAHWSYLLDTDASLMYGSDWRDNGDGTFTAAAVERFYSPLDLYLAGFYGEQEVAPFVLIENPAIEAAQLPESGVTIDGTPRSVTVADLVAADGPRIPSADEAPREYRAAFLLLKRPEDTVFDRDVVAIDRLRREFATRFSILTGGRGVMRVLPAAAVDGEPGGPPTTDGGDPRPSGAFNLAEALAWLRGRQTAEGYWEDHPGTRLRDTVVALATLSQLDPEFSRAADALSWLEQQQEASTDYLARAARDLSRFGVDAASLRAEIVARRNADGGWGVDVGHASDPLDTALVLGALAGHADVPQEQIDDGAQYLLASQSPDGGWSHVAGTQSRTGLTTTVLRTLDELGRAGAVSPAALSWLASKQNASDGGFGDSPSTVHDTANVLAAVASLGAGDTVDRTAAEAFLRSRQSVDGGWDGSAYATARAISALKSYELPDLGFAEPLIADPPDPRDGERVDVRVLVTNRGSIPASASVVRLHEGDPAQGVAVDEQTLPALADGGTVLVTLVWDSTDHPGNRTLSVLLDAEDVVEEPVEADNLATVEVAVQEATPGVDLAVVSGEISVSPAAPDRLPTELAISAIVRNTGLEDAQDATVSLWLGDPGTGELLAEQTLPLVAQRGSVVANFTYLLADGGNKTFTVTVASPAAEDDLDNNHASVTVTPTPSLDYEVDPLVTVSAEPVVLGTTASFDVTLRNRGTFDGPPLEAAFLIDDGSTTVEIDRRSLAVAPGQEIEQNVAWAADRLGELSLVVEVDDRHLVAEIDETNNRAELPFTVTDLTQPDFEVALEASAVSVADGEVLDLVVTVTNAGAWPPPRA
ncbi:MAG: hypothetical protein GY719_27550 [bacterium]|nr:hypothetical protein [bacterium]